MKIPKKVKIAGHDYRVEYPYMFKDYEFSAEVDHDTHVIRIAGHSSNKSKKVHSEVELNLLHELLHSVNSRYLPRKNRLYEGQIEQMSVGLYQVLKENKVRF